MMADAGAEPATLTIDQALHQAIAEHQAGRLPEAERLYRAVLHSQPAHPDANHNLGVLAVQVGQPAAGLPHFKAALEANPSHGQYWFSYIDALMQSGQLGEARAALQLARERGLPEAAAASLAARLGAASAPGQHDAPPRQSPRHKRKAPNTEEIDALIALFNSGRYAEVESRAQALTEEFPGLGFAWKALGTSLKLQGKDALYALRNAAELLPSDAEAHSNLGNALRELGRLDEAVASCRRALEIKRNYAEAHNNLGNALRELGRLDEAIASFRRALEIRPDYADAHSNLGIALAALGQSEAAVASLRRALQLKPDRAEVHSNLGNVLRELGRLDEAIASFRRALELKPDYAEAHSNLGIAMIALGHADEAVQSLRRALEIKPDYAEAYLNLGVALKDTGRLDEAVANFCRALEIKPDQAETHNNLGNALKDMGRLDEAESSYRHALQLNPGAGSIFSNLLFALNYHPDKSGEEIFEAYREYNARYCLPLQRHWRPHGNGRDIKRRLKVGYVSPDFRRHPVGNYLEPLLAHHDRENYQIYAYAELFAEDEVTARYKRYVDQWIPTAGISDDELAARVRADGIDILVDLAGHSAGNRLGMFARKPAPVSLSWLGFGYSTGLTAIDYILFDEYAVPAGCEGLFSERPWRLPSPGYVYRPAQGMGEVNALPAMRSGRVTFGTLSRGVRINYRVIRTWAEILKRVPDARLVIDSKDFAEAYAQDILIAQFADHGVGSERLQIGSHSPPWDVLRGMDIGLDCFPHNSGTTLWESLYMGVPFVTLSGRPSVGRLGGLTLRGAGHDEWIAGSEEEYVEKAVALAGDLPRLSALRAGLRQEMQSGPLMDEPAFARKVEEAYRSMWKIWCGQGEGT